MDDQIKGVVNGKGDDANNRRNLEILSRIQSVSGIYTDKALADLLGVKPQNVTQAKKRGIPQRWIVDVSKMFNCTVNYLLYGDEYDNQNIDIIEGHETDEGGLSDSCYEKFKADKDIASNEWQLMGKVYKVLKSDTIFKKAIISNINAFYEAIEQRDEINDLKTRVKALEVALKDNLKIDDK